jgi:hypothetical protein
MRAEVVMSGNSKRVLAVSALVAGMAGCTFKGADSPPDGAAKAPAAPAAESLRSFGHTADAVKTQAVSAGAPAPSSGPAAGGGLAAAFASLKLIRTAQATLEVADFERAAREVARIAEGLGGYVADTQATRGPQDRQSGTVTIRVPAERFAAAMEGVKGLGKVRAESVSTQDVTREYADLETRLRVKRDTAERLRELLRARTAKLADVLEAERELARVTEEIERMEGERRFYDQQVALSTIALTLVEPQALVEPGVFAPIAEALRDSASVLAQSLAALVYLAVLLAPWSVAAFAAWRVFRAVRARRKAAA